MQYFRDWFWTLNLNKYVPICHSITIPKPHLEMELYNCNYTFYKFIFFMQQNTDINYNLYFMIKIITDFTSITITPNFRTEKK